MQISLGPSVSCIMRAVNVFMTYGFCMVFQYMFINIMYICPKHMHAQHLEGGKRKAATIADGSRYTNVAVHVSEFI